MGGLIGQTALLTFTALRGIGRRRASAAVSIVSVAAMAGVMISLLAIREGTSILRPPSSQANEAIVLARGAADISQSSLSREAVATIMDAPGIRRTADGRPYAYASIVIPVDVLRRDGQRGAVNLAGYTGGWQLVDRDVQTVAGRPYRPALRELMVSEPVRAMFHGLDLGDRITLHGTQWTVAGVFASSDSQADSFLRTDAATVMAAFGRNTFAQVNVRLESAGAFKVFAGALTHNPAISVDVKTVGEQYELTFGGLRRVLTYIAWFIGGVMACGAVCGSLNSLYASVDSRRHEIATLRALGFNAVPIVASTLIEGMLIALPGALLGGGLALLAFNGDWVNSGSLIFKLSVTPYLLGLGVSWALAIGLIGASLPALRAAGLPVADALRAS
jgi:putative ABC transport system permease protein